MTSTRREVIEASGSREYGRGIFAVDAYSGSGYAEIEVQYGDCATSICADAEELDEIIAAFQRARDAIR
jgi:hypothetical protein